MILLLCSYSASLASYCYVLSNQTLENVDAKLIYIKTNKINYKPISI